MKKFLIIIVVLLVILALGQGIYYNIKPNVKKTENISSSNATTNELIEEKSLYVVGMNILYNDYSPKMSLETLENKYYTFINIDLPAIFKNIDGKNMDEIKQYYKENTDKIKAMHIYQEEELVAIAKQLQNIYNSKQEIVNIYDYSIDADTITSNQNGLISFDTIFYYDNSTTLKVKFTLSEKDENLEISSASDLDKIFENYTGSVKRSEFLSKLESFIPNVKDIRESSTLKSKNEKMQYYDLNKDKLNDIGIYSAEDFVTIANQVNTMKWKYSDISYISFEVDKESMTTDENYLNFIIKLYYTYDSETDLNIKLKVNSNNNEPDIRFSGVIKEAN